VLPTVDELLETLLDFGDPDLPGTWEPLGDRVMGGRSLGRMVPLGGGWAAFVGEVLLEGGGFASVRSGVGSFDLSGREGLLVEVRGDGRTYKLSLRTDPFFDAVAYQARFETRPGERTVHRLPFGEFRATWRGRPVPGAPVLAPSRICSFGLVVGDRQGGPFRLEISAIRAWRRG
jgi:NADH dehydrogenase [ubiquinone] 1 alpha subcomplex assembly factor 1